MELMQLLLHLSDNMYSSWRNGSGFGVLKSMLDSTWDAWSGYDSRYWLRLPEPAAAEGRQPKALVEAARYTRAALYMPLLKQEDYRKFRDRIGIGTAPAPTISIAEFRVDPLDIPEYLYWHRMKTLVKSVLDWYDWRRTSLDVVQYRNTSAQDKRLDIIQATLSKIAVSNDKYLKMLRERGCTFECNSVFLMNLFFATRDMEALSETWDFVTEVSYQTIHNALVAQARMMGWKQLIRRILDGDPSAVHPFSLSQ